MPINGESRVYAELRNAVPILDAAINKICATFARALGLIREMKK